VIAYDTPDALNVTGAYIDLAHQLNFSGRAGRIVGLIDQLGSAANLLRHFLRAAQNVVAITESQRALVGQGLSPRNFDRNQDRREKCDHSDGDGNGNLRGLTHSGFATAMD